MLSNSLSVSSLNSLDQNFSCAQSTATVSFIAPIENLNSNTNWKFSIPAVEIINNGFPRATTTTSTTSLASNNDTNNNYENSNIHSHHSSYSSLTQSSSDITSSVTPLFVVNPCYQSPIFLHRKTNGPSTISPSLSDWNNYENKTLRSLQNFQMNNPDFDTEEIQPQPRSLLLKKRTISLQTVPTTINSFANLLCPLLAEACPQPYSISDNEYQIHAENCSAASMDWLNKNLLSRLTKLWELNPIDFSTSNQWHKRMQRVISLTNILRQIRVGKTQRRITNTNGIVPEQESQLYGMPLSRVQANTADGNPLPQFIRDIMEYITGQADLADGIFRKNGVNLRIQEIKESCSALLPNQPIPQHLLYDSTIHDLGDSLKRYFRDLPECLFTDRLSEMLEDIFNDLPREKHFAALQHCILLLPVENREALMLLLKFMKGIARHSATNQMTSENLAICWFPSLFHFSNLKMEGSGSALGRKLARRKTVGLSNEKEWKVLEAIKEILSKMIDDWERLLLLPKFICNEIRNNSSLEICHDLEIAIKNGQFDFSDELHLKFRRQLCRLKEDYFTGWKSWQLQRVFPDGTQVFTRSINDMIPLKAHRIETCITASTNLILAAILHGRSLWDSNVIGYNRIGPSGQNFDIVEIQYRSIMNTHEKHAFLAREWTYSEFDNDSLCSIIECSIVPRGNNKRYQNCGNVSVFESKFLIKPIHHDYSLLIYISRTDLRGRPSHWYDTVYGEMLVNQIRRLKQRIFKYENEFDGTVV